ncbi:hypothetical protein HN018_26745 (plasmid) [Lichenicola cladoniae]|uniref:Uncharacterized protein n=1 Tax=Lichenicola cladoniae TaxID=1484109 RepID=A0A6M8HZB4_9PROT|nr:hypothetical protein [Lichenicola cladoniae]NPD66620.1 hypothetical protein [Acetobacteraceae bacterium]QKE93732.1 hypothetical protein HN018_26745 [Lichenicola cladoniae]
MLGILLMIVAAAVAFVMGWCFGFRDATNQDRQAIDALSAPWNGTERRQDKNEAST